MARTEMPIRVHNIEIDKTDVMTGTIQTRSARNILKTLEAEQGSVLFSAHTLHVAQVKGKENPINTLEIPEDQKQAVKDGTLAIGITGNESGINVQLFGIKSDIG